MMNLQDAVVVATVRDAATFEYEGRPSRNNAVYFTAHSGGVHLTPAAYMATVSAMRPDVYVTLADETYAHPSKKRADNSARRSAAWLAECLEAHDAAGLPALVLAAVMGHAVAAHGRHALEPVLAHDRRVAGYYIAGTGLGESPAERRAIVEAVRDALPGYKPRFVSGVGGPDEVLEAVRLGADIIESRYATDATSAGQALVFCSSDGAADVDGRLSRDDTKINLHAKAYALDDRPILEGCKCYACTNHTRAYIHHLLETHELLGWMLLEYHNTHHMQRFMSAIRNAVCSGELEALSASFSSRRKRLHADMAGDGEAELDTV